tara:strand:+ start:345 stop:926 length:582 start_codon:yes stop_codon:yes gene_type:complete
LYIGAHKGSTEDGYVCSSKLVIEQYNKNPKDWTRQIIAEGTFSDMIQFETKILKADNAARNPVYYNQHNGDGKFYCKGVTAETRLKISRSHIGKKASAETRKKLSESRKRQLRSESTKIKAIITSLSNLHTRSSSGYKGVTWNKAAKKWQAQIQIDNKTSHIGHYDSIEEAALARQKVVDKRIQQLKKRLEDI